MHFAGSVFAVRYVLASLSRFARTQLCDTIRHGSRGHERRAISETDVSRGKVRSRAEWSDDLVVSRGTGLCGCGVSCCTGCIQLDTCSRSYFDRQRRVNCGRVRAGRGASAGISAVGHARTSRVAFAGRKRCRANQFFVCCFRRARLRNAYSGGGRITHYGFLLCSTSAKEQGWAAGQ